MATATPSPNVQPLLSQRRFIAGGLVWGGIVLLILGIWLRVKYVNIPDLMVWALWLMAAAAGVLAVLQWRRPAGDDIAALESQKRGVGLALGIAGLALAPAGLYLLFGFGLQALGESFGMITLAVIALGTGAKLTSAPSPAGPFQDRFLRGVIDKRAGISTALMVIGGALAIFGIWLVRFAH